MDTTQTMMRCWPCSLDGNRNSPQNRSLRTLALRTSSSTLSPLKTRDTCWMQSLAFSSFQ
eukprot:1131210-Rhodomonas_salina.1